MAVPDEILTVAGVGGAAVVGSISKSAQWVDPRTGKFSWTLMGSGIALCLIFGSVVHWAALEKGIDVWTQIVVTGVGCYIGPDPILRGLMSVAFKRFGVTADDAGSKGNKPE